METTRLAELLMHGNQLKRTARTGWGQRGIPLPESVAAHSYGVVYTALILAELIDHPLDMAVVLTMATLHDLPEGLTSDIPAPAWRLLPEGSKVIAERTAMEQILGDALYGRRLLGVWEALVLNESAEARLVHDADKLDQFLQAVVYERQTGNRQLDEFWSKPHRFHFAQSQDLYDWLRRQRDQSADQD